MRTMGQATSPLPGLIDPGPARAAAIAAFGESATDEQAEFVSDLAEATDYGKRRRFMWIGLGALGGVVAGAIASRFLGR